MASATGSMIMAGADRSRKVNFGRIARKPAPMLVPDRLAVNMTVKVFEAASSPSTNQPLRTLVDD
jgi:hypothetical protein